MENQVKPGQVYMDIEGQRRFRTRTLRVDRIGTAHPIYPGRLKAGVFYAFCVSTAAGKKSRKVAVEVSRLLSKDYSLIEQQPVIA